MTNKLLQAAQAALDALNCTGEADDPGHRCGHCDDYVDRNGPVRLALREAIEAALKPGEPDHECPMCHHRQSSISYACNNCGRNVQVEYIAPPADSLRTAIEHVGEQSNLEPVALRGDFDGYGYRYVDNGHGSNWRERHPDWEPLYTHPTPAQPAQNPLTDDQIGLAWSVANAIEAKHGIGVKP